MNPEYIGPYKVLRELGRGSMATVYLARQESLARDMAIKLLAPQFARDEEFVERFRREGRTVARLRHPYIVQVYDFSEHEGLYFIAMEYLGARTLKCYLDSLGGKATPDDALRLVDQLLQALEHAHSLDIVHRDVKPSNIMVTERNEVTLTDFSIAHIQAANRLTRTGLGVGTPEYMAPEQFDGKAIDGRADLYATGVILYEMLTGGNPFRGETVSEVMRAQLFQDPVPPHTVNSAIPKPLGLAIVKALAKKPDQRYASAAEMREVLQQFRGGAAAPRTGTSLDQFLEDVSTGRLSLDEANMAREKMKSAIDQGFRKTLTFMMVDLAGSSKIKIPNQTLHADRAFRDYRATINAVLKEFGCQSYEWAGDGAICIFEKAPPAVQAAVKIQQLVDTVGERHPDLPDRLRARIGINTGETYIDPRRGLGEFASRTVDQAGHLEKDCPVGEVHVSRATMELTRHLFDFAEIGVNRDDVTVYQVKQAAPAPAPTPPASSAVPEIKFCPNCGQKSIPGARFCASCGFESGSLTRIQPQPDGLQEWLAEPAEALSALVVPVVFLLERSCQVPANLLEAVNAIWRPARLEFRSVLSERVEFPPQALQDCYPNADSKTATRPVRWDGLLAIQPRPGALRVFGVREIPYVPGPNLSSFQGDRANGLVLVCERYKQEAPERTWARALAWVLGLHCFPKDGPENALTRHGGTGTTLSPSEIERARAKAASFRI